MAHFRSFETYEYSAGKILYKFIIHSKYYFLFYIKQNNNYVKLVYVFFCFVF